MSDFNSTQRTSPFDRDLFRAAKLGAKAAEAEINQPGNPTFSDKVRYDFRKGILARYVAPAGTDEWTRERIAEQRKALNAAYYGQDVILQIITAKPEIPDFELPEAVEDTSYSIPAQREASELVSA